MTNVLDGLDPRWEVDNGGLLIAVDQLVNGGNKLPDVAEEKEPYNGQGDACQPVFSPPTDGTVGTPQLNDG